MVPALPSIDVKVRQAISQAIDAETLVEVIMLGLGTELPLSYYHPDLPWSIDIPGSYDPDGGNGAFG